MRKNEKHPEWEEIYEYWKYSCKKLYEPIVNDIGVTDIYIDPSVCIKLPMIDWWPTADIKINIEKNNPLGYRLNKGTLHTLELLLKFKDNPEGIAATWIAASLKDKQDYLPEVWRGKVCGIVDEIYRIAEDKIENLGGDRWYYSSRDALPLTLFKGHFHMFGNDIRISSWRSLINWVALENVLVRTTWTIVQIYNKRNVRELPKYL